MKQLRCFMNACVLFIAFFLFSCFFDVNVSAVEYTYSSGKVEEIYKDVVVTSFRYDYIAKFNGESILDDNVNVANEKFYGGKSIVINYDEYSHLIKKDKDSTRIYKYNVAKGAFDISLGIFTDKSGSYTLNTEGIYKIEYRFGDEVIHFYYVTIKTDLHGLIIKGDARYKDVSVFSQFAFNLKVQDGYDLKKNKYYYGFGTSRNGLKYREFSVFSDEENLAKESIHYVDKDLTVEIKDGDASINGAKKYFFVKVVTPTNEEYVVQTVDSYEISSKIQANVYLIDDKDNVINEHISFGYLESIKFKILFNASVTYSGLQFSLDGVNFIKLPDSSEAKNQIVIEHVVDSGENFVGDFSLLTKNNIGVVVVYENSNASVNVISHASFDVDVTAPIINILEDGEEVGKKEYAIMIDVSEENLKEVFYYVSKCSISQGNECLDKFDDNNIKKVNLGNANNPSILIDESFGRFNGENLSLFIKAIDKAGNESNIVKTGYVVDNVIVPAGGENNLFNEIDIKNGDDIIGKELVVKVKNEYNVASVSYKMLPNDQKECVLDENSAEGEKWFKCLAIDNYDFRANIFVNLVDLFENEEEYSHNFKFSTIANGSFVVNGKRFETFNDKNYEIMYQVYNSMRENEENVIFDEDVLAAFYEKLNFERIPDFDNLSMSVVYLEGELVNVLMEGVVNFVEFPTIGEVLKDLGHFESFAKCAVEKCDVELYLKYDYKTNGIPQTRLVQVKFIDNSNKYLINGFESKKVLEVGSEFVDYEYKYISNLNLNIDKANITILRKVVFKDVNGVEKEASEIDTSILGKYIINETFEYEAASSFPLIYTVEIVDSIAPVIRLLGSDKIVLNVGENFEDPFVSVSDNYDKTLDIQMEISPELDLNKAGTYVISYWCIDSSGNKSEVITRTIVVKEVKDMNTYLICGGIVLFTILVMIVGTISEVKKEKRRK